MFKWKRKLTKLFTQAQTMLTKWRNEKKSEKKKNEIENHIFKNDLKRT